METTVNIADLVTPKFKPGQMVFIMTLVDNYYRRTDSSNIHTLVRGTVQEATHSIVWEEGKNKGDPLQRSVRMKYKVNGSEYWESQLITSLDDLPAEQRSFK